MSWNHNSVAPEHSEQTKLGGGGQVIDHKQFRPKLPPPPPPKKKNNNNKKIKKTFVERSGATGTIVPLHL